MITLNNHVFLFVEKGTSKVRIPPNASRGVRPATFRFKKSAEEYLERSNKAGYDNSNLELKEFKLVEVINK